MAAEGYGWTYQNLCFLLHLCHNKAHLDDFAAEVNKQKEVLGEAELADLRAQYKTQQHRIAEGSSYD